MMDHGIHVRSGEGEHHRRPTRPGGVQELLESVSSRNALEGKVGVECEMLPW